MKRELKLVLALLAVIAVPSLISLAQSPSATKYQPTEVQSLRMQVAYDKLQMDLMTVQQDKSNILALGAQTKKENKWPDAVNFDPDHGAIYCDALVPGPQGMQCPTAQVPLPPPAPEKPKP